jgi:hypothetical protein
MTAVLDVAPETGISADRPRSRARRPAGTCLECRAAFERRQHHQLFCSAVHKRKWNNRWMKRGAVLAPLIIVARLTRNGSEGKAKDYGKRASRDCDQLVARWRDEDRAEGRMDVTDYVAARYRLNLVEVA